MLGCRYVTPAPATDAITSRSIDHVPAVCDEPAPSTHVHTPEDPSASVPHTTTAQSPSMCAQAMPSAAETEFVHKVGPDHELPDLRSERTLPAESVNRSRAEPPGPDAAAMDFTTEVAVAIVRGAPNVTPSSRLVRSRMSRSFGATSKTWIRPSMSAMATPPVAEVVPKLCHDPNWAVGSGEGARCRNRPFSAACVRARIRAPLCALTMAACKPSGSCPA